MSTLSDYISQMPQGNPAAAAAGASLQQGLSATAGGLQQTRLLQNYTDRLLPDLTGNMAAQGNFYSGLLAKASGRVAQDTGNAIGDSVAGTSNTMSDLQRQKVLSMSGIVMNG